jgi:hypothetical protein
MAVTVERYFCAGISATSNQPFICQILVKYWSNWEASLSHSTGGGRVLLQ